MPAARYTSAVRVSNGTRSGSRAARQRYTIALSGRFRPKLTNAETQANAAESLGSRAPTRDSRRRGLPKSADRT
jgi:hypothetical protein